MYQLHTPPPQQPFFRTFKKSTAPYKVHNMGLRYIITIKVPVVFMARYVMVLRSATSLLGALEGVGPENLDFFGPKWHDVAPLKTIMYRAIKTTGTLIVT